MSTSFFSDLRAARARPDLTERVRLDVVRDASGTVREVSASALVPALAQGSLADVPFDNAVAAPDAVALRRLHDGRWHPVTAGQFAADVAAAARGLVAAGVEPGERVALMARTRYEWTVLDFAVWTAGGQTVPVFPTSSAEQLDWILRDAGAVLLLVETPGLAALAAPVVDRLDRPLRLAVPSIDEDLLGFLTDLGHEVSHAELERRRAGLTPDTIATLVHTSGTTGRPKGCVLTHANLHAGSANLVELLQPVFVEATHQQPTTLMFLPLAHVLGRMLQLACLIGRITIGLFPSIKPDELRPELERFGPSFLVAVPYFFEKVHDTARAMAERMGRGASFVRADRIAVAYGEAEMARLLGQGPGPGVGLRAAHALYDLLVYRRVRKALGGSVRYAISGGSALDTRLAMFFFGCGIVIYQGYGLTETSAATTVTPPLDPRPASVGRPVPGATIRIAEDGEVLLRGGSVFSGYWNNAAATEAALPDAWLATGDLGALDGDGFLTIVGRKKDILVTSGGKNVSPSQLEDRLRSRPPVGQCMVVGDGRHYVAALVTLDPEAMQHWLGVRKRPLDTPFARLREDPELLADVQAAVDHANAAVSRAESIRRFVLVEGEFSEENGLLTPSLKVKRHAVAAAYAREIEELYGES
ncbi:long-chain fatty acid--CoA ligase [Streptacidiphilus pinicola]|uniref:Long-chain fatty acid--CoA ligase n=1 Tax=Streptacidiphilus pinicola TaxID=2219663 RepID=A0A2X0IN95_9ACTN|nr:AMP-dependent synthetase/ligase [Streptacidiphilus pinicola]RAG84781.1 long-chain fatty acid--CoA ligase [Streptacidiphilus pinicola]